MSEANQFMPSLLEPFRAAITTLKNPGGMQEDVLRQAIQTVLNGNAINGIPEADKALGQSAILEVLAQKPELISGISLNSPAATLAANQLSNAAKAIIAIVAATDAVSVSEALASCAALPEGIKQIVAAKAEAQKKDIEAKAAAEAKAAEVAEAAKAAEKTEAEEGEKKTVASGNKGTRSQGAQGAAALSPHPQPTPPKWKEDENEAR